MHIPSNIKQYFIARYVFVIICLMALTLWGLISIDKNIKLGQQISTYQNQITRQGWLAQRAVIQTQSLETLTDTDFRARVQELNEIALEFETNHNSIINGLSSLIIPSAQKDQLISILYGGNQSLVGSFRNFNDTLQPLILDADRSNAENLNARLHSLVYGPVQSNYSSISRILQTAQININESYKSSFLLRISFILAILLLESQLCTRPVLAQVSNMKIRLTRVQQNEDEVKAHLNHSQQSHKALLLEIGKSLRVPLAALNGHLDLAAQETNPQQRQHHVKASRDALKRLNHSIEHMLNQCSIEGSDMKANDLETLDLVALLNGISKLYNRDDLPMIHTLIDDRTINTLPIRIMGQPLRKIAAMTMRHAAEVNMSSDIMIDGRTQAPGVMTVSLALPSGRLEEANTLTPAIEPLAQRLNARFAFEPDGAFTRLRLTFSAITSNWLDMALRSDLKILVAEEDHDHAQVLTELLESKSVMVFYAGDVGMAIDETDMNLPDIALINADLPEGGLANYVVALKRRGIRIPKIIAMATDRAPSVRRALFDAGADSVITKPVVMERLMGILAGFAHEPKHAAAPNIIDTTDNSDQEALSK